ncbi:hypothetical protein, partial [Acinetobacter baumannii]|uniref:hypothetical protein n=1 Tax=Acinetobacter baumannii TaxID=470 RepID=UPI001C0A108E
DTPGCAAPDATAVPADVAVPGCGVAAGVPGAVAVGVAVVTVAGVVPGVTVPGAAAVPCAAGRSFFVTPIGDSALLQALRPRAASATQV